MEFGNIQRWMQYWVHKLQWTAKSQTFFILESLLAQISASKSQASTIFDDLGVFCAKSTGRLYFCEGRMNSEQYVKVLESKFLPSASHFYGTEPYIFQDDSAPIHRSSKTRKWIAENGIEGLPWPSNSPDLNHIENLWKILKLKISQKKPTNIKELKRAVIEVWRTEISSDLCRKLVESMQKRCLEVLKNNGGHTKYWGGIISHYFVLSSLLSLFSLNILAFIMNYPLKKSKNLLFMSTF